MLGMSLVCTEGCGFYREREEEKNTIAIIAGREITAEMLERFFFDNLNGIFSIANIRELEQEEGDIDRVKSRLFEDFIEMQLLLGEAIKAGVAVREEDVQEFLKEFGGESAGTGKAPGENRDRVRDFLMIQKFKSEKLFPAVTVSEPELKQYIDARMKELKKMQKVTLSIIMVETENEALELLRKIRAKKETFETLADKYAVEAGHREPQVYNIDELPDNIRAEVKRLKAGQVSKPLSLLGRFCLVRIESIEEEGARSFEEMAESMRDALIREKSHALLDDYVKKLKTGGDLKIFYERLPFRYIKERDRDDD